MWQEIMIAVISGLIGAGGVGGIITFGLNRMYNRIDRLEKDVTDLENERISGLEEDLKDHVKSDRSQEFLTEIKSLKGYAAQSAVMMQSVCSEQSGQKQAATDSRDYVKGLHIAIKEIRTDIKELMKK